MSISIALFAFPSQIQAFFPFNPIRCDYMSVWCVCSLLPLHSEFSTRENVFKTIYTICERLFPPRVCILCEWIQPHFLRRLFCVCDGVGFCLRFHFLKIRCSFSSDLSLVLMEEQQNITKIVWQEFRSIKFQSRRQEITTILWHRCGTLTVPFIFDIHNTTRQTMQRDLMLTIVPIYVSCLHIPFFVNFCAEVLTKNRHWINN